MERAEADPRGADPVRAALDLYIDFAALFVRILVILLRNAEKRAERERSSGASQREERRRHRR